MAEERKEALKKIAEKLKSAADKAKRLKTDANAADNPMDQMDKGVKR